MLISVPIPTCLTWEALMESLEREAGLRANQR